MTTLKADDNSCPDLVQAKIVAGLNYIQYVMN